MSEFFTPQAWACAAIAAAAALVNFVVVAMRWSDLPDEIPHHFGLSGRPDRWGPKALIWFFALMPVLVLALLAGTIIASARDGLVHEARQMSILAAFLSALMLFLTIRTIMVAEKRAEGLGRMFVPMMLVGIAIIIFLLR
jgi:uncharacterized membrane protein